MSRFGTFAPARGEQARGEPAERMPAAAGPTILPIAAE
jgi:hypothetical protein